MISGIQSSAFAMVPAPRHWEGMPMDRVRNLTPHDVVVITDDGPVTFPSEGRPARLDTTTTASEVIETAAGAVPIVDIVSGEPTGLPDPEPNTWLIVSSPLALRLADRDDVLVPTDFVRRPDGSIEACRSLGRHRGSDPRQEGGTR